MKWVWVAILCTGTAAFAADNAEKVARAKFAAAQKAYDLGQFAQALTLYSEAHDAKPLPAFLFNIAQCHRQLGDFEHALFFYRRFLSLAPPGTDTDTVNELIAQTEKQRADQLRTQEDAAARQRTEEETARQLEVEKAREAAARAEALLTPKPLVLPPPPPPPPPETPVYKRWWLWAGVGVVAAGTATGIAIAAQPRIEPPTYGTLNAR